MHMHFKADVDAWVRFDELAAKQEQELQFSFSFDHFTLLNNYLLLNNYYK